MYLRLCYAFLPSKTTRAFKTCSCLSYKIEGARLGDVNTRRHGAWTSIRTKMPPLLRSYVVPILEFWFLLLNRQRYFNTPLGCSLVHINSRAWGQYHVMRTQRTENWLLWLKLAGDCKMGINCKWYDNWVVVFPTLPI